MKPLLVALLLMARPIPTELPKGEEPLVDVQPLHPRFKIDIVYATKDNFAGVVAYPEARCVLRQSVAERMVAAQEWLDAKHPGHGLLFKDCYRPNRVQHVLWNAVKDTPKRAYVANPNTKTGSIHSYGAAVDLTLYGPDGRELDMGTEYDHLGKLAEPRHQGRFVLAGRLTRQHVANRALLRDAMLIAAKMRPIPNEWWHFNADTAKNVRAKYRRLDVPFSAIPRETRHMGR